MGVSGTTISVTFGVFVVVLSRKYVIVQNWAIYILVMEVTDIRQTKHTNNIYLFELQLKQIFEIEENIAMIRRRSEFYS